MKQEIKYKGYSVGVSDYDCADGELSAAHGLLNEEGSLRVLEEAKRLCQLPAGCRLMYIHSTAAYRHYIIGYEREQQRGIKELYWMDASIVEGATSVVSATVIQNEIGLTPYSSAMPPNSSSMQSNNHLIKAFDSAVDEMVAQGNTLVVMTADGMHYCLWRPDDRRYDYLGQKPPELQMEFGVSETKKGKYKREDGTIGLTYIAYESRHIDTTESSILLSYSWEQDAQGNYVIQGIEEEDRKADSDSIWAIINKTNEAVLNDGHFYAPFMVRYCYRLFDGTTIMHSAPVFMPLQMPHQFDCMSNLNVAVYNDQIYVITFTGNIQYIYRPVNVALKYKVAASALEELGSRWKDIVKSVDVFVSLPLYREKPDEEASTTTAFQESFIRYKNNTLQSESETAALAHWDIPMISEEEYLDKIKNVSTFYKVASLDLNDEIATDDFAEVPIKSGVLSTLAGQEAMKDDYKSHNTLLPLTQNGESLASMYVYNQRLNVAGIKERLFVGFGVTEMVPHETATTTVPVKAVAVKLNTVEGTKTVVYTYDTAVNVSKVLLYNAPLFYPDNRAIEMDIYLHISGHGTTYQKVALPMTACPMLNGAYTEGGIITSLDATLPMEGVQTLPTASDTVSMESKLYTSEIDNPFYFGATGINTIGTGRILGIRSATKALSEGQFGQHPLYAFTTDGVWALTVATDGTFHAVQPVCRDICSDAESITQLDDAVLFATDRGVMVLSGATAKCLTDTLMTDAVVDLRDVLPKYSQLQDAAAAAPFREYLQGCRMVYDYTHQRVTLYNPTWESNARKYTYGYVYSIKTGLWGLTETDLAYGVNSYPDTLAVDDERYLVSLSDYVAANNGTPGHGLMVTRPLKLGDGNALKTVHTVLQRGYFRKNAVATILWGSRDLMNWHLVASSATHELRNMHGTPYKWFRIGAVVDLRRGESLSGATVEFDLRYTDKLH